MQRQAPVVRGAALEHETGAGGYSPRSRPARMAAQIFQLMADEGVSVDMIIQSQRCRLVGGQATRDIAFTVAQADAAAARRVVETAAADYGFGPKWWSDEAIAKV